MARIKIEDIRAELLPNNWKVISEEYVNLDTEMIFECPEGHKVYTSWKKIRQKRECPICDNNQYKKQESIIVPPKKKNDYVVLALDQATKISGYSVYYNKKLIHYGIFKAANSNNPALRNNDIKIWVVNLVKNWRPDLVGIEGIQLQEENSDKRMGVTVFETLARLQGVLMDGLYESGIKFQIAPTNTWRKHCGVKGATRAQKKKSMQSLVKEWFDVTVSEDEADAIGIGKYLADTFTPDLEISNWE